MAAARGDAVQSALVALRAWLREGRFPPGERIASLEVADSLRLSATPVREALSRLAGEGLIEDRPGQGYFVRALSGLDVADLYRLSLAHLEIALDPTRSLRSRDAPPPEQSDPVREMERLLLTWVREGGGRALFTAFWGVTIQLGPVRRKEPRLFDVAAEAAALWAVAEAADPAARRAVARTLHAGRIVAADRLAELVQREARGPQV